MKKIVWSLVVCLVAGLPAASFADFIVNGSFEDGVNAPTSGFRTLKAVNTDITGWTIRSGSVDWIGSYWTASDGQRSIDLAGLSQGLMIGQTVTGLDANQTYRLSFDMAGNPDGAPMVKEMRVSIDNGGSFDSFFFDTTGHTKSNMGWETQTLEFTGMSDITLWFFSVNNYPPGTYGPALDNVRLEAVPAPGAALLGVLGLSVIGWFKRRFA